MEEKPMTLADAIGALRTQLEIAANRQRETASLGDKPLVPAFLVKEIVLETEVIVGRDNQLGGKLNYWIATAEGKRDTKNSVTQRISIKLEIADSVDPETGETKVLELGTDNGTDVV